MPINWREYPADWNDVIRPAILKRDSYCCVKCKVRQRAVGYRNSQKNFVDCDEFLQTWAKANGKKLITIFLSIAHLDHDITNNSPENLASLCQQCHNQHDAKQRAFRRTAFYRESQLKRYKYPDDL